MSIAANRQDLVLCAQNGDAGALDRLLIECGSDVRRYAMRPACAGRGPRQGISCRRKLGGSFNGSGRRAVLSGFACIAASSAAAAPPPLRTNSSQFIEMRPVKAPPPMRIARIDGGGG